jgi:hypothetical protein
MTLGWAGMMKPAGGLRRERNMGPPKAAAAPKRPALTPAMVATAGGINRRRAQT